MIGVGRVYYEELFAKAIGRKPNDNWHYVRAAEALLNIPPK